MEQQQIIDLTLRWTEAERHGDTATLSTLLTDDFVNIGPAGFLLDKTQWLERYQSGNFQYTALAWQEPQVRVYGDAAIVTGTQVQEATYQGQPSNGQFRGTQVYVRQGGQWKLAGMQLSPIAPRPAGR
ncbi:hypothetical protein Dcar01_01791 [Deinococcus carri]|uniref:DUF4440 domain-containing protein n=1 Tax=Deinococcus carri TaxID=1211323 RepID=A0ABP9W9B0_9DEIO